VEETCSIAVENGMACPGGTVELELTGCCAPDCWNMGIGVDQQPEHATVSVAGSIPCDGEEHTANVQVAIHEDAPQGPINFELVVNRPSGLLCSTVGTVTVLELALTETPAAYLPLNSNTVQFTASITPPSTTDHIRFELLEVSDFPGDAMNHGTQADDDPDLKFEVAGNPGFTVSSNQLTATTQNTVGSATVTVSVYDYGARGKIKATLVNLGCESVVRVIPKDADGDWLPDAYEDTQPNMGSANADTDGDGTPDGEEDDDPERAVVANAGPSSHAGARTDQGLVGDGLVAFEEYRGFFVMGTHTRTTTQTKDVFAGVDESAGPGAAIPLPAGQKLGFFHNLSGFEIREIEATNPNALEWNTATERFINFQRSGVAGVTDQRALRIVRNDGLVGGFGITHEIPGQLLIQSPNETDYIEINVNFHYSGLQGVLAGPDGIYGTADDATRTLTTPEADDALRETVGHECGHGVHVEHHFILGDEHQFPVEHGLPGSINITSGPNGVCETGATGNDVQVIPVGQGQPNSIVITDGGDGIDGATVVGGDDAVVGNTVTSGPDGIAQSTAGGNDVQVIPVGQGKPSTDCVGTGVDGISSSTASGDDLQRIPAGNGEPFAIGITAGPDGALQATPHSDDTVGAGPSITTGGNGILDTYADPPAYGVPSIMTSDLLLPIPNTYKSDDLDQARFHLKHP
jgi:hypothetical protein